MQVTSDQPPRYRIVVRGRLGERFGSEFPGMALERRKGETVLVGRADQAGLHGVFERLRSLGIDLVSVNEDA
jgi:hypothetical protein